MNKKKSKMSRAMYEIVTEEYRPRHRCIKSVEESVRCALMLPLYHSKK